MKKKMIQICWFGYYFHSSSVVERPVPRFLFRLTICRSYCLFVLQVSVEERIFLSFDLKQSVRMIKLITIFSVMKMYVNSQELIGQGDLGNTTVTFWILCFQLWLVTDDRGLSVLICSRNKGEKLLQEYGINGIFLL